MRVFARPLRIKQTEPNSISFLRFEEEEDGYRVVPLDDLPTDWVKGIVWKVVLIQTENNDRLPKYFGINDDLRVTEVSEDIVRSIEAL